MNENVKAVGILLAAGNSVRMGMETNKLLLSLSGKNALYFSAKALIDAGIKTLFVTVSESTASYVEELSKSIPGACITPLTGGVTRAMSVLYALRAAKSFAPDIAVIHDAARCAVTVDAVKTSIDLAAEHGSAIAMTLARDTIRSTVTHETIKREEYALIQTPQTFRFDAILEAYESAYNADGTIQNQDDCAVYQRSGHIPHYFDAGLYNQKLTYPGDIPFFEAVLNERSKRKCE